MMYCIKAEDQERYVERLLFNDCGVGVEFTSEECRAARLSDHNALTYIMYVVRRQVKCRIVKHSGAKPDMESELRRLRKDHPEMLL